MHHKKLSFTSSSRRNFLFLILKNSIATNNSAFDTPDGFNLLPPPSPHWGRNFVFFHKLSGIFRILNPLFQIDTLNWMISLYQDLFVVQIWSPYSWIVRYVSHASVLGVSPTVFRLVFPFMLANPFNSDKSQLWSLLRPSTRPLITYKTYIFCDQLKVSPLVVELL